MQIIQRLDLVMPQKEPTVK